MISWPVIINYHGDDELVFVASESEWNNDTGLSAYNYHDSDVLIDNNGHIYQLNTSEDGIVHPRSTKQIIPLDRLINLVQRHAASQGECCIEKISFKSLSDGIQLVAGMCDE